MASASPNKPSSSTPWRSCREPHPSPRGQGAARRLDAARRVRRPGRRLTRVRHVGNLLNVALATSVTALLAAGQTFVIILAEIDLSVGAVLGFSAVITAMTLRHQST